MIRKKLLKILFKLPVYGILFMFSNVFSQETLVTVQNDKETGKFINIKWYSQDFVYKDGVNVYRNEKGRPDWTKLNDAPLKQWPDMPKGELAKDSNLRVFVEIMKQIRPDQLNGMVLLHLMAESFVSPVFCKFIGIHFDDQTATSGKTYTYKILRLTNGNETLLGTSDPITAGSYIPKDAPKGFTAKQFKKSVQICWEPEDKRFYAMNVYRKNTAGKEIKLNHKPVTLSMMKDSTGKFVYPTIKYVDDSIKEKKSYNYRIAGVDFFGNETMSTDPVKVGVIDFTLPSRPVNLQKKIKKLTVDLSWTNTETRDLAGFNVYRSQNDENDYVAVNPKLLAGDVTSYLDNVPKSGGYYYMVAAVDSAGNENFTDKTFADVADLEPPAPPKGVVAIADTGRIKLSWQPNTEPDLMGYQVYRTINGDNANNYVLLNAIATRTANFTDSLPGVTRNRFFYKVTAIDTSFNRSGFSLPVSARMPDVVPPAKPFIKNVSRLNEYLVIEWLANTEPDLAGYEVYRSRKDTIANYHKISEGLIDREVTRFTDRNPIPDTTYNYYLLAIDSTGNRSLASDYFTARLPLTVNSIEKSGIHSFTVKANKKKGNRLQWKASTSKDFIGFAIYRKTIEGEAPVKLTGLLKTNEYTDHFNGITKPTYQLRLYHKSGEVVKSEWLSIK